MKQTAARSVSVPNGSAWVTILTLPAPNIGYAYLLHRLQADFIAILPTRSLQIQIFVNDRIRYAPELLGATSGGLSLGDVPAEGNVEIQARHDDPIAPQEINVTLIYSLKRAYEAYP